MINQQPGNGPLHVHALLLLLVLLWQCHAAAFAIDAHHPLSAIAATAGASLK